MLRDHLEKIFKHFDREPYLPEIGDAKKEYFDRIGAVFETDNIFEVRMAAFFDWFIFERPIRGTGLSPLKIYYHVNEGKISDEEKRFLESLNDSVLSLYLLKGKTRTGYELVDLYDNSVLQAKERGEIDLIGMGKVIEARVIKVADGRTFSDPLCSNPLDATEKIIKAASKLKARSREEFRDFIFKTAAMSIRLYRYKHLAVDKIYVFK